MPDYTLLHNPRCSKSRATRALLEERGVSFEIVEYLSHPLTVSELRALESKLERPVREWLRAKEAAFTEAGLSAESAEAELFAAMAKHPVLMERPILIAGNRAVVGRPPEDVLALVEGER